MTNVKDRLKALRRLKSITQTELAESIGLSTPTISSIEVGRTAPEETLKKIAEFCKVDYNWLYRGTGEAPEGIETLPTKETSDPWRDALIKQIKEENERLWQIVQNLTGSNFPKSPKIARALKLGVLLGDHLSKAA